MVPELFHLWETASEPGGAILIGVVLAAIVVTAVAGYLLYRRRIGPVVLWSILFVFFFGFSQLFPENRSLIGFLATADAIGSGIVTWVITRMIKRHTRSP